MIATVRLLTFVPFHSKFRNGTGINNVGSRSWHLENAMIETLDGDAVRCSGE
jgi:hypothetical protein